MFDDFLRDCLMNDKIKPSKKRVKKNYAALRSLIEKEESSMKKRRIKLRLLIAAAAISVVSMVTLLVVGNAAPQEVIVKFTMGGEEIEGKYYDYVDNGGVRHIWFTTADMPYDDKFEIAAIYDMDAPRGENIRILTNDTDPDFFENVRSYVAADKKAWEESDKEVTVMDNGVTVYTSEVYTIDLAEFGLAFEDNEFCTVWYSDGSGQNHRQFGGKFIDKCEEEGKPSSDHDSAHYDGIRRNLEKGTFTFSDSFYYYVGKDFKLPEAAENTSESGECQTAETADNTVESGEYQTVETADIR